MTPTAEQCIELVRRACTIRAHAYAPYSRFPVGASLLTASGEYFDGVNVENASFGMTICAERSALASAVTAGHRQLLAIAVASQGHVAPCGACRQVLAEFDSKLAVLLVDPSQPQKTVETSIDRLLPGSFKLP